MVTALPQMTKQKYKKEDIKAMKADGEKMEDIAKKQACLRHMPTNRSEKNDYFEVSDQMLTVHGSNYW